MSQYDVKIFVKTDMFGLGSLPGETTGLIANKLLLNIDSLVDSHQVLE